MNPTRDFLTSGPVLRLAGSMNRAPYILIITHYGQTQGLPLHIILYVVIFFTRYEIRFRYFAGIAFMLSLNFSNLIQACNTPSIIASGRAGHPGT